MAPALEKPKVVFLDVKPVDTPDDRKPPFNKEMAFGTGGDLMSSQPQKDIVYENVKPVMMILRGLGAFPITRPKPGLTLFSIASPAMAYSVFIFIALIAYIVYLSMNRTKSSKASEGRFEEAVISYLFTIQLCPLLIIPIMWYETKKIAEVFNSWTDFEICYRKVSGRPMPLGLGRRAIIIAIVIPVLSTASVFITHATMIHFKLKQVTKNYFYNTNLMKLSIKHINLFLRWYRMCFWKYSHIYWVAIGIYYVNP